MLKFRTVIFICLSFIMSVITNSCVNNIDRTGFLPPVRIEIPQASQKNKKAVEFIKSSEKIINSLSDKMEAVAKDGLEIVNKKNQQTVLDQIKMAKLSIDFFSDGNKLNDEMQKIQNYIDSKQKRGINESELQAYKAVEKAFENRVLQLNKKYNKLFK